MTQFFLSVHWKKIESFWPKKLSHLSWEKNFKIEKKTLIVLVTQLETGSL